MRHVLVLLLCSACGFTFAAADGAPEWAVAVFPSGAEFVLEIAASDRQRQQGYMYREEVSAEEGMLFLFPDVGRHSIWMKNCRVPLDIVWLDDRLQVIEVLAEFQPCPPDGPCAGHAPMRTSRYVLEIAAGRAAAEKLVPGDTLILHSDRPLP